MKKVLLKLSPTHSMVLNLKLRLLGLYSECNQAEFAIDRSLELIRERLRVLKMVDDGESRLEGFLNFRLHCALNAKLTLSDFETRKKLQPESLKSFVNAKTLLQGDYGCPQSLLMNYEDNVL